MPRPVAAHTWALAGGGALIQLDTGLVLCRARSHIRYNHSRCGAAAAVCTASQLDALKRYLAVWRPVLTKPRSLLGIISRHVRWACTSSLWCTVSDSDDA